MSAEQFLASCQKVKRTGPGRWVACCPAHEDSRPSMNVKEIGGKLLVICRAGCSVQEILDATGLPWSALFEDREIPYQREVSRAFPAADVLRALETEALIVALAASTIGNMQALSEEDRARVMTAYHRIYSAVRMTLEH